MEICEVPSSIHSWRCPRMHISLCSLSSRFQLALLLTHILGIHVKKIKANLHYLALFTSDTTDGST